MLRLYSEDRQLCKLYCGKVVLLTAVCTLDITQAYNQTFLEGASKPGMITEMQWGTLNCDKHSHQA